jgi:hypothetical protein
LSRSRFYEYEVQPGIWEQDPTGDLGRIQRQNVVIEALIDKAESTYNPLTLNAFIGSVVHDVRIGGLSSSDLLSLAVKYHGFAGSSLRTATVPTFGAGSAAGSVEVVEEPQAQQVIAQFLGDASNPVVTPPLDGYGSPVTAPTGSSSRSSSSPSAAPSRGTSSSNGGTRAATAPITQAALPAYDPKPC